MKPEQQFIFAVIVSVISLLVSLIALGWNIYRDVMLKPRLKVRFSLSAIHHSTFPKPIITLLLKATNFGPGNIKCSMIQLKNAPLWRRLLRKTEHAFLMHDYENPLSGKLPTDLNVGGGLDLLIRYEKDCFLKNDFTHIGLSDSFDRIHWAPHKDIRKAKGKFVKDFGVTACGQQKPQGSEITHKCK
jgi:hypothetical protein